MTQACLAEYVLYENLQAAMLSSAMQKWKLVLTCGFHISGFHPPHTLFLSLSFIPASFYTGMSANASNGPYTHDLPQFDQMFICYIQRSGIIITTALTVTYVLFLLPVYICVLYLGFKRWRRQSTAASHSDFLAYHAALVELISVLGFILICCGIHAGHTKLTVAGIRLSAVQYSGQLLFQILTCAERYLAVVHPVAYMRQKNSGGTRIRNIIVGCSWLLSFSAISLLSIQGHDANVAVYFLILGSSLAAVLFFSFSVLCILIRPRPAEVANNRQQVDQQKVRAFKMMMAILSVLVLKFASNLLSTTTYILISHFVSQCNVWFSTQWMNIPSMLVIPLLYLQRQRKAQSCKHRKWKHKSRNLMTSKWNVFFLVHK